MIYAIFRVLFYPFFWLIFRPIIFGHENFYIRGKAIFVCNHMSMMDPVILALTSPRFIHFMAKAELFKNYLINILLRSLLAFPVNRKQYDTASLKKAMRLLNAGKVFGIFPEGKRAITNDLDDLEKGAAFLAIRSGAPIVPIYIKRDSYKSLRLVMAVGDPIFVSDIIATTPKSQLLDTINNEISDAIYVLQTRIEG